MLTNTNTPSSLAWDYYEPHTEPSYLSLVVLFPRATIATAFLAGVALTMIIMGLLFQAVSTAAAEHTTTTSHSTVGVAR